jgi:hypothetical protein
VQVPDLRAANTPLPDLGQMTARTLAGAIEMVHSGVRVSPAAP